jgi:REP element-mobilizing transposase RayT
MASRPNRQTIRLREYDYCTPGSYFVTICTHGRSLRFLDSRLRSLVEATWASLPEHHRVTLDVFVVMPNHVHGVLQLEGVDVGAQRAAPRRSGFTTRPVLPGSLPAIVRSFKSASTKAINDHQQSRGSPVWQRGYYEHIIRTESELNRIRQYIANNPANWRYDAENPRRDVSAEYLKAWSWLEGAPASE